MKTENNMKTFTIKKEHLDKDNFYTGLENLSDFDGNVDSEENLNYVKFKTELKVTGYIIFKAGSGIKAGLGIKAGSGIKAGWYIEAGSGIEAGLGIKAGWYIEAGSGIKAGLGIMCKRTLSAKLRIFAGLCLWRKTTEAELLITCEKLIEGEICYGILKEVPVVQDAPKPEINLSGKVVTVELDGIKYSATIN